MATGRSNEHGLKVLIAKAEAGDIIWFLAMVNRIAVILAANGDTDTADVRRSKAIGILATPARALQLLTDYADKGGDPNQSTCGVTDQNEAADAEDEPVGEGDDTLWKHLDTEATTHVSVQLTPAIDILEYQPTHAA